MKTSFLELKKEPKKVHTTLRHSTRDQQVCLTQCLSPCLPSMWNVAPMRPAPIIGKIMMWKSAHNIKINLSETKLLKKSTVYLLLTSSKSLNEWSPMKKLTHSAISYFDSWIKIFWPNEISFYNKIDTLLAINKYVSRDNF